MEYEQESLQESFPQHLCKMCGQCCSAITTPYTHEELKKLAQEGQEEAKVFVEIFERYETLEAAKKACPQHVENVLKELKKNPDFDETQVSFYHCPHLTAQKTCAIHPTRPDCCRRAPRNGWSLFPPGCGFKGWQFKRRENIKATVRRLKETLMDFEFLADDFVMPSSGKTIKELKETIHEKIRVWEKYGSAFW